MKNKNKKKTKTEIQAQIEVLDIIGGDLPDGAYFAMAEEMGLDISDFAIYDEEKE